MDIFGAEEPGQRVVGRDVGVGKGVLGGLVGGGVGVEPARKRPRKAVELDVRVAALRKAESGKMEERR